MEDVSISDYRGVLMCIAGTLGIKHMSTDSCGASGLAWIPSIFVSVDTKKEATFIEQRFLEMLESFTGDKFLFNIRAVSTSVVIEFSCPFMINGEWIDNVN